MTETVCFQNVVQYILFGATMEMVQNRVSDIPYISVF